MVVDDEDDEEFEDEIVVDEDDDDILLYAVMDGDEQLSLLNLSTKLFVLLVDAADDISVLVVVSIIRLDEAGMLYFVSF